jgi:hypothetical protein
MRAFDDEPCHLFVLSKMEFENMVRRYPVLGRQIVSKLKKDLLDRVGPAATDMLNSCLSNPLFATPVLTEIEELTKAPDWANINSNVRRASNIQL